MLEQIAQGRFVEFTALREALDNFLNNSPKDGLSNLVAHANIMGSSSETFLNKSFEDVLLNLQFFEKPWRPY